MKINKQGTWTAAGGEFRFFVDSEGKVQRFVLSGGRAHGIEFKRALD